MYSWKMELICTTTESFMTGNMKLILRRFWIKICLKIFVSRVIFALTTDSKSFFLKWRKYLNEISFSSVHLVCEIWSYHSLHIFAVKATKIFEQCLGLKHSFDTWWATILLALDPCFEVTKIVEWSPNLSYSFGKSSSIMPRN